MLESIQRYFQQVMAPADTQEQRELSLELAVAALLCEVVRADGRIDAREQAALREMLMHRFSLDEQAVAELVELARQEVEESVDHYQFVRLVNEAYGYDRKVALIGRLWRLAYADGALDPYEEARVRKLAELLYVDHADFIMEKLRVQKALGIEAD